MDHTTGAYIVPKRPRPDGGGGGRRHRVAAALIAVLLILTAAIIALIVLLPYFTKQKRDGGAFEGRTFYFLAAAKSDTPDKAYEDSVIITARGGAGYIYNDGSYRIIAAVYKRESDAAALSAVNSGSSYFAVYLAPAAKGGDTDALEYLCGEWSDILAEAAAALDRGNITAAAADYSAAMACDRLFKLADGIDNEALKRALYAACEYDVPQGRTTLSYIRYVAVRAIALVSVALS